MPLAVVVLFPVFQCQKSIKSFKYIKKLSLATFAYIHSILVVKTIRLSFRLYNTVLKA